MSASRAQIGTAVGVGGTGWAGSVYLIVEKVDEWLHPTTVQVLADQYSENLRVIAEGLCACVK